MKYGRCAIVDADLETLLHMVEGSRRHVEIGTLWGGSAIAVALHNPDLRVWCVDPFDGYYGQDDPYTEDGAPDIDRVRENLEDAGVADRVTLVKARSHPFPLPMSFDTGLIDGDHSAEAVLRDWEALCHRCDMVAFHDIDDPAIAQIIEETVTPTPGWVLAGKSERMAVFARV